MSGLKAGEGGEGWGKPLLFTTKTIGANFSKTRFHSNNTAALPHKVRVEGFYSATLLFIANQLIFSNR